MCEVILSATVHKRWESIGGFQHRRGATLFFSFFAQQHLFEPEYTDEELRQMDEAAAARVSEYSHRAAESRWCDGGKSKAVPTEDESLRCSQTDGLMPPFEPVWQFLEAREHRQVCRVAAALMSWAECACRLAAERVIFLHWSSRPPYLSTGRNSFCPLKPRTVM